MQDLLWHLTSAYMKCVYGWAGVRNVITKFSRMDSLPHFLTHGAPPRARFARARAPLLCCLSFWMSASCFSFFQVAITQLIYRQTELQTQLGFLNLPIYISGNLLSYQGLLVVFFCFFFLFSNVSCCRLNVPARGFLAPETMMIFVSVWGTVS